MIEILEEIKRLIKVRGTTPVSDPHSREDAEIQAVTAMLLLEAAYGDEEYVWCEHRSIVLGLKRAFGLSKSDVDRVLSVAHSLRPPHTRLADATRLLAESLCNSDRLAVVELLWRIVDADGVVHAWELVFASHIATSLGLSEEEAATARRRSQ